MTANCSEPKVMNIKAPLNFAGTLTLLPNPAGREQQEKSSMQRRWAHLTEVTSPLLMDLRNTSARSD